MPKKTDAVNTAPIGPVNADTPSIAISLPACRSFSPTLSVDYGSGGGNGIFGIGFSLAIPSIIRKTSKKVPTYDEADIFVLAGADDLVPIRKENNADYEITFYQPRIEGIFDRIEQLVDKQAGSMHWRVTSKNGNVAIYGKNKEAQIYDLNNSSRIAEWLLEDLSDVHGNKIFYHYRSSNIDTNQQGNGKVIDHITYGCYNKELNHSHFEVLFDYSENDFSNPVDKKYRDQRKTALRQDPFTSHITGFSIRNELLCKAIRIYHRFDELSSDPILVNGTYFDYDEKPTITYLRAVKQVGYYEREAKRFTKSIPTLVFSYTSDDSTYVSTVSAITLQDGNRPSKALLQILKEQDYTFVKDRTEIVAEDSVWSVKDNEKELLIKKRGSFLDLHNLNNKNFFRTVKIQGVNKNLPGYFNDQRFQSLDLYQEGIEGILYNDGNTILYFRPNGNGEFSQAKLLEHFPSLLRKTTYSLLSLESNGELQLYINAHDIQGYHDFDGDSKWSAFKPIESQVINLSNELQEMIDVTGDGRADIIVFEGEQVIVYPSAGKKGYEKAIYSKAPTDLPNQRASSESVLVRFADMFGDGKSHLVKVENGKVECWPNLGYGIFGEKVTFKNAPHFRDGLNAKRLYFSDIDGSGTTDLVYANHDSLDIYYNNSGNSFSQPVNVKLPVDYNHISRIEFADILGNGTNCLLISYLDQSLKLQHIYYDFYNGVKPHLLKQIDNNMGSITHLNYAASTKFYLQDRKENRPWVTSLPFPVQVIEKIETIDHIVGSKLTNRYRYHHGFYDYTEKEFRGFGFVETWDTEDFSNVDPVVKEHYVAPIYTKTWYHTGAYNKVSDLVESYRKEFYQGDSKALKVIPNLFDGNITSIEDKRQAYRAMQGQILRQEVYGLDKDEHPNLYLHPYFVIESSSCVRLLKSSANSMHKAFKYGIFFVNLQETISYHYERNCCDPRIQHDFVLEMDTYGNIIKSASITYPRRSQPNNHPEQQKLYATLAYNFYANNTQEFYLLGIPYKSQSFELGGLKVAVDGYTHINDLRAHVKISLEKSIKFEKQLDYANPQARLLSENYHYYWNETQDAALPIGSVTKQALLHHTEAMAFSDSQIKEVFGGKITSDQMLEKLGYQKSTNDANFWLAPSPTQYYFGTDKYYLPKKIIDIFGAETAIVYDRYALFPIKMIVKATETSSYETRVEYDYQRLTPVKLIDYNDNVSEVLLNPLGVVIATSIYDKEKGDRPLSNYQVKDNPNFEDILGITDRATCPKYYLQNATSFFYYDLQAWRKNGQPVHVINLQRETHVSESIPTRIRKVVTRIDGFGRNLETKMLTNAETGEWLTSDRVVYNNKGAEVKKYEPFYSCTPYYDFEEAVRNQGVSATLYYDPLLRNIRVDTPKGFFSKVEFDPWKVAKFDLNDTVKDSSYYQDFMQKWAEASVSEKEGLKDEKDALDKALKHYNTPTIEHLDSLGRKFLQIEILSKDGQNLELKSHVKLDIQGNELESIDPRFYEQNKGKPENERIKNFVHVYAMTGIFKSTSVDVGETWNLANVAGSVVYNWDGKGSLIYTEYDKLQRPVSIKVRNEALKLYDHIVERFFYSEDSADKITNRYGTLIAHYDQAGLTKVEENDFKGQPLKNSYLLRKTYKQEANWQNMERIVTTHPDLEQDIFNSSIKYNALGEVIEKTDPQNNRHIPVYDIAGRVKQIKLKKSEDIKIYVSDISYNPKGQRISIKYRNDVITNYSYDPKTFNLTKLVSANGQKKLQSIHYTYDPVGNITRIYDASYKTIFPESKNIDTHSDYHYDSLYRLVQATGKEHPTLRGKEDIITPIPHLNNQNAISSYTEYYDFDYGSNITKIRHIGGGQGYTKNFYISNKSNRSLAVVDNMPVNENDIDYNYDENGNLLKLDGTKKLHWNYRNNIAYVDIITRPSGKNDSEYYVYDSSGQRVRKVTETYQNDEANHTKVEKIYFGDIEVTKTYRGDSVIKERYVVHVMDDKSRVALHHYWAQGSPEKARESQDRYQLGNHLDSAVLELNDHAEIITYEEYLPFGGTALVAGETAREVGEKEYRYSGKERDEGTGLYYYGARYYAPWLARWINPDPAGTVDGPNLYQFVGGNPVINVDVGGRAKRKKSVNSGTAKRQKPGRIMSHERKRDLKSSSGSDHNWEKHRHSLETHIEARFIRFVAFGGLLQRISDATKIDRETITTKIITGGASTHQDVKATHPEHASHIIQAHLIPFDDLEPDIKHKQLKDNYKWLIQAIEHTQPTQATYNNSRLGKALDHVQEKMLEKLNDINFASPTSSSVKNLDIITEIQNAYVSELQEAYTSEERNQNRQDRLNDINTAIKTLEDNDALRMPALTRGQVLFKSKGYPTHR